MSKWTDAGFPDKLHLAPVPTILYALYSALYERAGGASPVPLEYLYRFPIDDLIMTAFRGYYCRGKDGWFYEVLPKVDQTNIVIANDDTLRYLCENILDVEFIPNHYLGTKYSAEYAKCRYHIINSMMAPRGIYATPYNFIKYPDVEAAWISESQQNENGKLLVNNYASTDYFSYSTATGMKLEDNYDGYWGFWLSPRTGYLTFDLKLYIYATNYVFGKDPSGNIPYNDFNSGISNSSSFQKKIENCKGPVWGSATDITVDFYTFIENIFSYPPVFSEAGMSLFLHKIQTMQSIYQNEDHSIQMAELFYLPDATPYLEYLDFDGELEIPEIPEVPVVPGGGGGGGGDDDDDDDDDKPDKPDKPQDPYPDLDIRAYVVICRHVLEGAKKEVIYKQYTIVQYGYVSSRLPAGHKHVVWYPLYTERIYQQPPDYPVYQWEYCFIKTNLDYMAYYELLELWAKTTLEPDGYERTYLHMS